MSIFSNRCILMALMALFCLRATAQEIDPNSFDQQQLVTPILNGINEARWRSGMDSVLERSELSTAAVKLADGYGNMAKIVLVPEDAGNEAKKAGATRKVQEIAVEISVGKGKTFISYQDAAKDAIEKILKNKKFEVIAKNPKYVFAGAGAYFRDDKKKVYLSLIFGGIDAFNAGAKDRKTLALKYTKSKRGLYPYDEKGCKNCAKYNDLETLYEGVKVEGNKVYLEYNDFKKFKKYFKNPGDGVCVEFVQRKQYPCGGDNIFDYNLNSKGFLFKPALQAKLLNGNLNTKNDPKNNTYKGVIAKLPKRVLKKIDENYEINLYFILDRNICKIMNRQYLEGDESDGVDPLAFYPDSITSSDPSKYFPKPENQTLTFKIPFEKNKTDYNKDDIKGFLDALKEPQFVINEINIQANSSLEGDSVSNAKLQQNRAKSIVAALEKLQGKKVIANITTSDSWDLFQQQIKGKNEYKEWQGLSKSEVIDKLNKGANIEMESLLAEERFAAIEMKVTYDFTGANEETFVCNSLRKAIVKKDVETAKRISRFLVQQIVKKRYGHKQYLNVEVPEEAPYVPIIVSQLFIDNKFNHADSIYTALRDKMNKLSEKYPNEDFAAWNKIYFDLKTDGITDVRNIIPTQTRINQLYNGRIPQRLNDALNLEYQFRIIEKVDTLDASQPNDALKASMDRIKKIFNLEAANWENALKLATIFQRHGDLTYARKLLEPYLSDEKLNENLVFTYIAIAAHFQDEIYGRNFRLAMSRASEINQERFCKLFGAPYLSFQVLDNPAVKKVFCDSCK